MKATYFNKQKALKALRLFCRELGEKHPEVEQVLLFGSLARGETVPGSDVDVLVILTQSSIQLVDRIPLYTPDSFPMAIDVFPYTRAELTKMVEDKNPFILRALREGRLLYRRGQSINPKRIREICPRPAKRKP